MDSIEMARYVRYLPIIKRLYMEKYDLSSTQVDILIFIHGTRTFRLRVLYDFTCTLKWQARMFADMKSRGFIKLHKTSSRKLGVIYQCSVKTDKIMKELFDLVLEQTKFSDDPAENPVHKRENYTQKYHSIFMKRINQEREQRPAQVLYDTDDSEF
jgi:hypothetical protein